MLPENKAHFLLRNMALLISVFKYKTTKNFVSLIQKFSVFIDWSFMNMNFFLEGVILWGKRYWHTGKVTLEVSIFFFVGVRVCVLGE